MKKKLFTPGPLNTPEEVRQAMMVDVGSREEEFVDCVRQVREALLAVAGVAAGDEFAAVPMQGSGTFALESALTTLVPNTGKLLVLENGAYGERMVEIARRAGIPVEKASVPPTEHHDPGHVGALLEGDPKITHVALVHCETTTGILNPVQELAQVAKSAGRTVLLDSMSGFGALPLSLANGDLDVLVSSANKCLEGVPGCAFVLVRADLLAEAEGVCPSLSLDLHAQWQGLEGNGQFRFTPPTHVLLALRRALELFGEEGGVEGRLRRYEANHAALMEGMSGLGFRGLLPAERQSPIITAFPEPDDPAFDFDRFTELLAERGQIIYPGKLPGQACFRIGSIGRLQPEDLRILVQEVEAVLQVLGVALPITR